MIEIYDDALLKEDQDYFESFLLSDLFPYYFRNNTTYQSEQDTCQFQHNFYYGGKSNSKYFESFFGRFKSFINQYSPYKNIIRMKSNLLLNNKANTFNSIHRDYDLDHINLIYYVNNSDGDTFLFDENIIIKTVSPKKGRILLFDGKYEHASSNPINSKYRSIININLGL
jgi:hypothetical protein